MTPEQFVYWLQGFMEINDPVAIDSLETQIIKDHLAMVFEKKTPDRKNNDFGGEFNPSQPPFHPYEQITPLNSYWSLPPYEVTCTSSGFEYDPHQKFC